MVSFSVVQKSVLVPPVWLLLQALALPHWLTHFSLTSPHEVVSSLKEKTDFPWVHIP